MLGRGGEQASLLLRTDTPMTPVVFVLLLDQGLVTTAEGRPLQILASDGPVEHVPQERQVPVDRGRSPHPECLVPLRKLRGLLQVGHKVVDIGALDVHDQARTELHAQGCHAVVDGVGRSEAVRLYVLLDVEVRELVERQAYASRFLRSIKAAFTDGLPHPVVRDLRFLLGADIRVRPPIQASAIESATMLKPTPPRIGAPVAVSPLVFTALVQPHQCCPASLV
ncbi:MAG: hypothetical protein A3F70_10275 [Acidobacteria bacterium RIFCSPLOWO2_12_FULL_67_14]|nr:MAG: hypothetical protein A3H29_05400 [Acidobacteria bacterium RIFCSPLOWO2_02_FULL_67_21]OFW34777.1 MAG: hypothetical protein A3F70_10275 [Acidobacteria bacterium RIFCSPLOWO2_12_FULL_67_14]